MGPKQGGSNLMSEDGRLERASPTDSAQRASADALSPRTVLNTRQRSRVSHST